MIKYVHDATSKLDDSYVTVTKCACKSEKTIEKLIIAPSI